MIDRDVAALARKLVSEQAEASAEHEKESSYRALCESLPILLRTAGLSRTVMFLAAKEGTHKLVLDHLQQQLRSAGLYSDPRKRETDLAMLVTAKELSLANYRHLSSLAFRVAYWHKRLAQALLRKDRNERAGENR